MNERLCRRRWREAIAAAHGTYLEVKRGMLRMAAIVKESLRSLLAGVNLRQRWGCRVGLTEVSTKSALTLVDGDHKQCSLSIGMNFSAVITKTVMVTQIIRLKHEIFIGFSADIFFFLRYLKQTSMVAVSSWNCD